MTCESPSLELRQINHFSSQLFCFVKNANYTNISITATAAGSFIALKAFLALVLNPEFIKSKIAFGIFLIIVVKKN